MNVILVVFALLRFSIFCIAAGPLQLPDIMVAATEGHVAVPSSTARVQSIVSTISSISNLTSFTQVGVGVLPRPEDPSTFEIQDTTFSLRFSDYGQSIPAPQVLVVLVQALLTIVDKVVERRGNLRFNEDREFAFRHAGFIAYAGQWGMNMSYDTLASAIKGMVGFMIDYGTFGYHVDILDSGGNRISNCLLTHIEN